MKVTRVGGRISRDRLPPGGQANHGWLAPRGATCPGGKINWDTGIEDINGVSDITIVTRAIKKILALK